MKKRSSSFIGALVASSLGFGTTRSNVERPQEKPPSSKDKGKRKKAKDARKERKKQGKKRKGK